MRNLLCVILIGLSSPLAMAGDTMPLVDCRIESDHTLLQAGEEPQKAVLKISLDAPLQRRGPGRPPVNVAVVLDRSGSMQGEKIVRAREAALEALRRLGPGDYFSLVTYSDQVTTVVPAQRVSELQGVASLISRIEAEGSTALFGGVSQGAAEVRRHQDGNFIHRIILLSDGLANVGPSSPADLGRLGAALAKEHISVSTIGVGDDYNEDLMTRLSLKSDGNSYYVRSSGDLPNIFGKELGEVLNIVANDVTIWIHCGTGVKPLGIIGLEGRIDGSVVRLDFNQLYGGQHRYILLEVEVAPGRDGQQREMARAEVRYNDLLLKRKMTQHSALALAYSTDAAKVEASVQSQVLVDYNLNRDALAQEQAIELADQGDVQGALQALKQSNQVLEQAAKDYDSEALRSKATSNSALIKDIEQKGVDKKNRKVLRTDAYQTKRQQNIKKKGD